MSDLLGIVGGITFLLLGALAAFVSFRRNKASIEAFEHPDLQKLIICVPDHRVKWARTKLEKLGWGVASKEAHPSMKRHWQICFQKSDDATASSLKEVLHSLNRSLVLPVVPLELRRKEPRTADDSA